MIRVSVRRELLQWARDRAGLTLEDLSRRFPKLPDWERGDSRPTLKQLEQFSRATRAPVGFLFLAEPPVERLPLPDFRIGRNAGNRPPSPDLLEMIYVCQQRQAWYRDHARSVGIEPQGFVGSARLADSPENVAGRMRGALGFDLEARRECPTWADALRQFIGQADSVGMLVMCSGVVMNNNKRRLDPNEFRGFAL